MDVCQNFSGLLPLSVTPEGKNLCQDDQKMHGIQAAVSLTILVPLASMQISIG